MRTIIHWSLGILIALIMTACNVEQNLPASNESVGTPAVISDTKPIMKTPIGEIYIDSARFVDEVHGEMPAPGMKILLVVLERVDGKALSTEDLMKACEGELYILGSDGSHNVSPMGGILESGETVRGFRIPESAKTYQLFWPGNDPVFITPVNG